MFLVCDKACDREKRIAEFLGSEPEIAVILAAAHFEWTVCRAILFMSKRPNVELREKMEQYHGLEKYKDLWKDELVLIGEQPLARVVQEWSAFKDAFNLRHRIIHGRDTCTRNMATPKVQIILKASRDIQEYCAIKGIDLYSRLPIRRQMTRRDK